MQMKFLHDPSF